MVRYSVHPEHLRELIRTRGYPSLSAFAQTHGLSRATLQSYLRGQTPISAAFYALATALETDPLTLLRPQTPTSSPTAEIDPLVRTLCQHIPHLAIGLLGSRATNTARTYSDWDLGATCGSTPLTTTAWLRAKQIVDDLAEDLPRQVDFINLDAAPTWFLTEMNEAPLFLDGDNDSWQYFLGVLHGVRTAQKNPINRPHPGTVRTRLDKDAVARTQSPRRSGRVRRT